MARKTKEEALVTRNRIIDAAEQLFHRQGVSRTSLHDIAQAAGVTRGAIYWHFEDKGDVVAAMIERACLPFEELDPDLLDHLDDLPLERLKRHLVGVLRRISADEGARRIFEIATQKVEYVDELAVIRERHISRRAKYTQKIELAVRAAQRLGQASRRIPAPSFAIGLHASVDGLIQNWLLDPTAFDLVRIGHTMLELQVDALRLPAAASSDA